MATWLETYLDFNETLIPNYFNAINVIANTTTILLTRNYVVTSVSVGGNVTQTHCGEGNFIFDVKLFKINYEYPFS